MPFVPSAKPKYVPKHRAPGKHKARRTWSPRVPAGATRTTLGLTGLAVAVTGVSVVGGLVANGDSAAVAANLTAGDSAPERTIDVEPRATRAEQPVVSRSDRRGATVPAKAAALSTEAGHAVSRSERLSDGDPRDIARALLGEYGFDQSQFSCLDSLYVSESNWRIDADNPTSSAYGIPQALTQTHDLPAGYMTSAEVQIRWGLDYIQSRYGTPCNAWSFKQGHNWY